MRVESPSGAEKGASGGELIDAPIPLHAVHGLYRGFTGTRFVARLVTDLYTADGPELAAVSQILGRAKAARNVV